MAAVPLIIDRILGRNGADPPQALPVDMAAEVLNADFYDGSLCRKRGGSADVTLNGFNASSRVQALGRYLPSDDETAAELHAVESAALTTMQRLAAGTTWATYTLANAIQADSTEVSMVSFNGKFFQAYNSSVNRLHVYPSAGGTHRRVGIAKPAAPAAPTEAAGAVTDVRQYAVAFIDQTGNRRSNLSAKTASVTLAAEQATVTMPTAPGDGETHWELYVYSDDDNFALGYLIATTLVATTTSVDNNASLAAFTTAPPESGQNTPPPSAKYLLTDGTHLLGAGAWETSAGDSLTPSVRMVWWTPALGTTTTDGDDERVSDTTDIKTYLYVDAGITGIGGPLQGNIYVFGYRHVWKMIPTGQAANAYDRITLRTDIGCIRHQTICIGEDEEGRPALYWLSHIGPYRTGASGIQYLGRDVEDIWANINLAATGVVAWGLFYPDKHQVWWFIATGASQNDPDTRIIFDCRLGRVTEIRNIRAVRYGWANHDGRATEARCGVLFANTLGATMSRDLKPYVGRIGTGVSGAVIWKEDTGTDDAGTNFQAYAITKAYALQQGQNMAC